MAEDTIQSLWIGPRLSSLEQLSIRSFLELGHRYVLYAYGPIEGVPEGTEVRGGEEILPADQIFYYRRGFGKGSPSAFSNLFRYEMLRQRGGWWCDLDVVCLKRFDWASDHILGYERNPDGRPRVASAIIKAPAGSPLMEYCVDVCRKVNKRRVKWGKIGPKLVEQGVDRLHMHHCVLPPEELYPIDYWETAQFVLGSEMPAACHGIHLWSAQWKHNDLDPDAAYDESCLYEQLRRRFGVTPPATQHGESVLEFAGIHEQSSPSWLGKIARRIRGREAA